MISKEETKQDVEFFGRKFDPLLVKIISNNNGVSKSLGRMRVSGAEIDGTEYIELHGSDFLWEDVFWWYLGLAINFKAVIHLKGHKKTSFVFQRHFLTHKMIKLFEGILGDENKLWYLREEGKQRRAYQYIDILMQTPYGDFLEYIQKVYPHVFSQNDKFVIYEGTSLADMGLKDSYINFILQNYEPRITPFLIGINCLPLDEKARKRFLRYLENESVQKKQSVSVKKKLFKDDIPHRIKLAVAERQMYRPRYPYDHSLYKKDHEIYYEWNLLNKFSKNNLPSDIFHRFANINIPLDISSLSEGNKYRVFRVEFNHFIPKLICSKYNANPHHEDNIDAIPECYHKELNSLQQSLENRSSDAEIVYSLCKKMIKDGLVSKDAVIERLNNLILYYEEDNISGINLVIDEACRKISE